MVRCLALSCAAVAVAVALLCQPQAAFGVLNLPDTLLDETFADNPVGTRAAVNGVDRYTYHAGDQSLTAAYNTDLPTSRLEWSLGKTLTQNTSFRFTVDFTIAGAGFLATLNEFAQIEFGLIHSTTTGTDRPGGTSDDSQAAFDLMGLTYFPNVSTFFDATSLLPTVITTDTSPANGDYFGSILAPFNQEDNIVDEGPLPLDATLTAVVEYDASTRTTTLTIARGQNPLDINTIGGGGVAGGPDGDTTTIQNTIPAGGQFDLDTFSISLWFDTFNQGNGTSVAADVTFDSILVEAPEPASAALLLLAGAAVIGRKVRH